MGVGIVELEGIVIRVGFDVVDGLGVEGDMGIMLEKGIEKGVVMGVGWDLL